MWASRAALSRNDLVHSVQENGRSPVCLRSCVNSRPAFLKTCSLIQKGMWSVGEGTGIVSSQDVADERPAASIHSEEISHRGGDQASPHARLALLQYLQLSEPIVSFGTTTAMDLDRLVGATGGSGAGRVVTSSAPKSLALLLLTLPKCGAWGGMWTHVVTESSRGCVSTPCLAYTQ